MTTPEHIKRILDWPCETWSADETRQVLEHRAHLHTELFTLVDTAEREERNFSPEERDEFQRVQAEFDRLGDVASTQR